MVEALTVGDLRREPVADDLRGVVARYLAILRRRWAWGFLALSIVGSIAFWSSQYLPRTYQAATVFERRDDAVLQNLVSQNSPYGFERLKSSLALDMTGLRARAEAAIAIGVIAPDAIAAEGALTEAQTAAVKGALARHGLDATSKIITSSSGLDVIELRAEGRDPELARRFVVALRDRYIADTQRRMRGILDSTRAFFEAELDNRRSEAAAAAAELDQHFAEFPDLHSRDPVALATRVEALRTDRDRLEQEQARLDAQIAARRDFLAALLADPPAEAASAAPGAPALNPEESRIDAAIRDVEAQISDAIVVRQMTPEHPTIRALRRKIDALRSVRADLADQRRIAATQPASQSDRPSAPRNPLARQVELDLDTLVRQREIVHADWIRAHDRHTRYSALARQLSDDRGALRRLEERVAKAGAAAAVWSQHLTQLEQVLAAENELRGTRFSLIEEPLTAARAASPRLSAVFTVSGGLALACAVLLMALLELFDQSLRDPGHLARVAGVPVLESVGLIATPAVVARRRVRRAIWSPALLTGFAVLGASATMAYASFERPSLHQRVGAALDQLLVPLGAPPLAPETLQAEAVAWER